MRTVILPEKGLENKALALDSHGKDLRTGPDLGNVLQCIVEVQESRQALCAGADGVDPLLLMVWHLDWVCELRRELGNIKADKETVEYRISLNSENNLAAISTQTS